MTTSRHLSRAGGSSRAGPVRVGLLVLPNFSMMALACASEPLRAANRLAAEELYAWFLLSENGGAVSSSSGWEMTTRSLLEAPPLDRVFIVASLDIERQHPTRVFRFLQGLAVRGVQLGALSTGTFILARAGLLDGRRCTLHWEALGTFAEEFPLIDVTRELFVVDGNRLTCAGGTAAFDLMLEQISSDYDGRTAADVAEQFLHTRIRRSDEFQRMPVNWRYGIHDRRITAAVTLMESNLEAILDIGEIATRSNLSQRQLQRLWGQQFDVTPQQFYLRLRLNEAKRLLRETTWPILTVALRCGFVSASHLGSAYRRCFGNSPGEERRKASRE